MEGLSFDNILGGQEMDTLFSEPEETVTKEEVTEPEQKTGDEKHDETDKTTEVVNQEDLFEDDGLQPESVGSEKKEVQGQGDAATEKGSDTSPQENFYSSIANALAVDGIFPNLDDETIKKANDAETFSELIEAEVKARFDEDQQRILKALNNGVEPSDIKKYENTLQYVSSITEAQLTEESEAGEQLRRNLIYQDYLNRGYSAERAQKMTERLIDSGNDVEEAKDALQGNKDFFQKKYNELLDNAQKKADKEKADRLKQEGELKESILNDKTLMGDMEISADVRKKVFDNISRPVYRDPSTGQYMTALQKYQAEHPAEFIKYVGLFMTLTDGFKDFKSFAKAEVRKEMKKGLRELENTLSNTRRTSDGRLDMVGSRKKDPESFLEGNFKLAL